jgi:hypothetical protein
MPLSKTDLTARLRKLLDTVSCYGLNVSAAAYGQALDELEILSLRPETAREILDTLLAGLLFTVRCDADRQASGELFKNTQEKDRDKAWQDLCELAFRCRMPRALSRLENIPELLRERLQKAAPASLAGFSVEELLIILLSGETPGWLCKTLLAETPVLELLGRAAYVPYFYLTRPARKYNEKQKTAEMTRVYAQAEKILQWFQNCPPEYLPPAIDNYPLEMQDWAARRLAKNLAGWQMDKILGLLGAEYLPAWLRQAAEIAFAGRAPLVARARSARAKRRRKK